MADRYFPNEMPDFIAETATVEESLLETDNSDIINIPKCSLTRLLYLPYNTLSHRLKLYALDLKNTVVSKTWESVGRRVKDYTLYTGVLGTAYLAFKAYQVTKDNNDLMLCSEIVGACDSASRHSERVTFICGRAGVCALGAVAAMHAGNERLLDHYITEFKEIKIPRDLPNELLYGRVGYLWACSFLNKHIARGTISSTHMRDVLDKIIKDGRKLANNRRCPLMFEWHGKKYWGAAHGLAGIMHVLMDMELKPDEADDVKGTLRYMINSRFPSGNYPSSDGNQSDRLVHWCHGAPGIALTLVKAAEVFGDQEFLQAAGEAGDVVWSRGLLKRVGICHGISGNAYVFLSLYRLTGKAEYLYRAKAFSCLLYDRALKLIAEGQMHGGDRPYSLFEGIGGIVNLFLDMSQLSEARFPAYEL